MKVKIKTEKQFLNEFGKNWRKNVYSKFPKQMDKYLGKIIILDQEQKKHLLEDKHFIFNYFAFSQDMIVSLSDQVNKILKL